MASLTLPKLEENLKEEPDARAFQFVTLDGSFNILQNCSKSQFVTVRSSKEFREVSMALRARIRVPKSVCEVSDARARVRNFYMLKV
jgi:hypothetical protein